MTHAHHWLLDHQGYGQCKVCHEERQFRNSLVADGESWREIWGEQGRNEKDMQAEMRLIQEQYRRVL